MIANNLTDIWWIQAQMLMMGKTWGLTVQMHLGSLFGKQQVIAVFFLSDITSYL